MNQNNKEFAITDLFYLVWANKFFIAGLAVLFAVFMFVRTAFFTAPRYKADGLLYVSNKTAVLAGDTIDQSDIFTSRALGEVYIEVLRSRSFLNDVSEATGGYYSWKAIRSMTSVSSVNDTELLSVSVINSNPEDARNIAMAILNKAPDKLKNVLNGGYVVVVDPVGEESTPLGTNKTRSALLGFIIGAGLAFVLVFLRNYFDKTVHRGEDVEKRYGISILGNVAQ